MSIGIILTEESNQYRSFKNQLYTFFSTILKQVIALYMQFSRTIARRPIRHIPTGLGQTKHRINSAQEYLGERITDFRNK